jgi:hypothetical protein
MSWKELQAEIQTCHIRVCFLVIVPIFPRACPAMNEKV